MSNYSIPFIQYMMPDGKKRITNFMCEDEEIYKKATHLIKQGCIFDIEVLQTGMVSMTCMQDEDTMLAIELTENNESITTAVEQLVATAREKYG